MSLSLSLSAFEVQHQIPDKIVSCDPFPNFVNVVDSVDLVGDQDLEADLWCFAFVIDM